MATMQSRSVRRREDMRLLTGNGNYSADPHPDGMLHAVLVRSHHAHATIGDIDTTAARAIPGVIAVFTAADLTGPTSRPIPGGIEAFPVQTAVRHQRPTWPLLAADRVARFVGEPVAVVLAGNPIDAGKDAAEAVMVDYHELPLVTDAIAAMEPGSPKVWETTCRTISAFCGSTWRCGGDRCGTAVRGARRAAAIHRVARHRQHHGSRAARGAEIGPDGRMVMHAARHQSPV